MPELPEVEVTRLGISGHLIGGRIAGVVVHTDKLRSPIPHALGSTLQGQPIDAVERRGKYLILRLATGSILLHLGMTGHLRIVKSGTPPGPHDRFDILLDSGVMLRFHDPRRFGSVHWTVDEPLTHKLLSAIGPEPLTDVFTGDHLYRRSRGRKVAVQPFIMDSGVVAGVGNIYAAESLFRSRLLPTTPAGSLSRADCDRLAAAIKEVLATAIAAGCSTMDFCKADDKLVYFPQTLYVYGREGAPCLKCGTPIKRIRLGTRSSFFCPTCQH